MKIAKSIILYLMLSVGCFQLAAQDSPVKSVKKSYYVPKAGTLVELMTREEADAITHLVLQGKLNAIDFRHLRDEFANLQMLDISQVSISGYAGKKGTFPERFYVYPPNCIPAYAFCTQTDDSTFVGKTTLRHVILPPKLKNIEDAAFKGCTQLRICQIRKETAPNLLKEGLADSITAVFVPQGCSDSYRAKPRWGTFAFIEGEPLGLSVDIGEKSSLAIELQRKNVQPKAVNFLTVKGKLDYGDFMLIRDYMPNLVFIDMEQSTATHLPDYTFTQKKFLLNVKLPHGLRAIGQRAFSGCGRLCGTLELPPTLTSIEYGAFIGCDNLRHVRATSNQLTTLGDNLFGEQVENKLILP